MKKLARAIVKMRRLILIAAVLLLIPAAVGAIATPINYDILSYLPQDLDSREKVFSTSGTSSISAFMASSSLVGIPSTVIMLVEARW